MTTINRSVPVSNFFKRIYKDVSFPAFIVLVIVVVANAAFQPTFFTYISIKNNLMTFTPLILVSMAQAIIIISGSLDLSLGSAISMYTIVSAMLMTDSIGNIIIITLISFAVVILIGAFNGTLVGTFGLPPLITTFGTSGIVLGIAILLMPVPGGYVPKFFYKLYSSSILNYIPFPLIILAIGIIFWIIISKTAIYKYIYAVGSNEDGAYAAGIKVGNVKLMAHVIAGFLVGLAGICLLLLTATGEYRSGMAYSLNSVAAVVIGGISLKGGKGSIWGAIIGALTLGLLNNIIFFASVSSFYQDFAKGMIIILSLSIAAIPRLRAERHRI